MPPQEINQSSLPDEDTGVKVTAILFINDDMAGDAEYGKLTLYTEDKTSQLDVSGNSV